MPKPEKIGRVTELKERIEGSDALLLAEYRGLTVSEITTLRRSLAEGGTRFSVVKNTLMRRAASAAAIDELQSLLEGPTAVAFITGDPVAVAKRVVEAAKKFPSLVLKGGFMEGRVLSSDEAKALADLESREVMLSKVAGMLKSEMSRAAAVFVSAQSKFLSLLEAYKEKLPPEEVSTPDGAEAPADDGSEPAPSPVAEDEVTVAGEAPEEADASATGEPPEEADASATGEEDGKE